MLYPLKDEFQEVIEHQIIISGSPSVNIHKDYYGNEVGTFTQAHPHKELGIDSRLLVETVHRPFPEEMTDPAGQWNAYSNLHSDIRFIDFLKLEKFDVFPEVEQVIKQERCVECSPLQVAKDLCTYIYKNFAYQKGITTIETTVDEIWRLRSGVCQDFAHILLVMLRLINMPARYVSGYVCPSREGMRGEGATHAWVEVYLPFYGWLGLDPTNNCIANETHVRLAVGKNFSDCSPVKGTYRGTSNHTLDVIVTVSYEDGRTTTSDNDVLPQPITSTSNNSFRRYQEIQMQQ
jgi:transglutaminase-like putative cysteine protease